LKHASPPVQKPKRASIAESADVGSMQSLTSEESSSPSESKNNNGSKQQAPKLETATSSEKTAVNALLMAAMAMTEMSNKNDAATPPAQKKEDTAAAAATEEDEVETPQKNLLHKFNSPKRKVADRDSAVEKMAVDRETDSSPSEASDDDSPKREYPGDNTPISNQQKVKRSRLGSHKKFPRNLGNEMEHQKLATSILDGLNSADVTTTPKTKGQLNKNDLTPVSARCIDFRKMRVNETNATQT
jgi:hypothetical protein